MKMKAEAVSENGKTWRIDKVLYVCDSGRVTIECHRMAEKLKGKLLVIKGETAKVKE